MEVSVAESRADLVRIVIAGRMDTTGVERAETRLYALFAPRAVDTLFDLSGVTVISSMGLRVLIASGKTAQAKGFKLALIAPPGPVRDVLEQSAIAEMIPVADDLDRAQALLRGKSAAGR
jgi:anti-sigma B factor antagonist